MGSHTPLGLGLLLWKEVVSPAPAALTACEETGRGGSGREPGRRAHRVREVDADTAVFLSREYAGSGSSSMKMAAV